MLGLPDTPAQGGSFGYAAWPVVPTLVRPVSTSADGCRRCAGEPLPAGSAETSEGDFEAYATTLCDRCLVAATRDIRGELGTARETDRAVREQCQAAENLTMWSPLVRHAARAQTAYIEAYRQLQALVRERYRRGFGAVGDLQWP